MTSRPSGANARCPPLANLEVRGPFQTTSGGSLRFKTPTTRRSLPRGVQLAYTRSRGLSASDSRPRCPSVRTGGARNPESMKRPSRRMNPTGPPASGATSSPPSACRASAADGGAAISTRLVEPLAERDGLSLTLPQPPTMTAASTEGTRARMSKDRLITGGTRGLRTGMHPTAPEVKVSASPRSSRIRHHDPMRSDMADGLLTLSRSTLSLPFLKPVLFSSFTTTVQLPPGLSRVLSFLHPLLSVITLNRVDSTISILPTGHSGAIGPLTYLNVNVCSLPTPGDVHLDGVRVTVSTASPGHASAVAVASVSDNSTHRASGTSIRRTQDSM